MNSNTSVYWAALQKQTHILLGDLNLDRLKPNRAEGKLLHDLEEAMGLQCLINQPTRVTNTTQTLIDVILTNQPDLAQKSGVYNPKLSDHSLPKEKSCKAICKPRTKNADDWQRVKQLRNEATRIRRKAIKDYWRKKANDLTKSQGFL